MNVEEAAGDTLDGAGPQAPDASREVLTVAPSHQDGWINWTVSRTTLAGLDHTPE